MTTLPTAFVDTTLHAAEEHGVETLALPEDKGLLAFASGLSAAEQCLLLRQKSAELQGDKQPAGQEETALDQEDTPASPAAIDCQVSVEERAQLFKFLTG